MAESPERVTVLHVNCLVELPVFDRDLERLKADEEALKQMMPHGTLIGARIIRSMPVIEGQFTVPRE
jgi:hypothetical protein